MREAFCDWVEAGMPVEATVEVNYEPTRWPARKLLGRMCHCSDVMPGDLCDDLEVRRGSTYAAAAQGLLRSMRRAESAA
jgi:hypothetical protein